MADIFRIYASQGRNNYAELDLPASDYEMLDLMERLRLEPGQLPYVEVLKVREQYDYLEKCIHELPDIYQLNALAKKLSELTSTQDMAAFEGLVGKEIQQRSIPIALPRLIDFAYSTEGCVLADGAMTDFQLGKFLVDNDFIEEANGLPESMIALLDFAKSAGSAGKRRAASLRASDMWNSSRRCGMSARPWTSSLKSRPTRFWSTWRRSPWKG